MPGSPVKRARRLAAAKAAIATALEAGQNATVPPVAPPKSAKPQKAAKPAPDVTTPIEPSTNTHTTDSKGKLGRPPVYSESIAAEIIERIASGETLNSVCRDAHMPSRSTVTTWLTGACQEHIDFSRRYARARDLQLEHWADEIIDAADDGRNDFIEREAKDGTKVLVYDGEAVNRSRLRVDARKWILSKLKPQQYGESSRIEMTGKNGAPIEIEQKAPRALLETARRVVFLLQRAEDAQNGGPQPLLIDGATG